jgi:hypothetical protein
MPKSPRMEEDLEDLALLFEAPLLGLHPLLRLEPLLLEDLPLPQRRKPIYN